MKKNSSDEFSQTWYREDFPYTFVWFSIVNSGWLECKGPYEGSLISFQKPFSNWFNKFPSEKVLQERTVGSRRRVALAFSFRCVSSQAIAIAKTFCGYCVCA